MDIQRHLLALAKGLAALIKVVLDALQTCIQLPYSIVQLRSEKCSLFFESLNISINTFSPSYQVLFVMIKLKLMKFIEGV